MKLGISYNLFDGEELLEASINSVRDEVFHISVVYQTKSYYGDNASPELLSFLNRLKRQGLIDEIYLFDVDFAKPAKHYYERQKRDIGLKIAKKSGCSHYLSMDVDEFYDKNQLRNAKNYILKNRIENSAVSVVEYLKKPEYKLLNGYTFEPVSPYNFYVPFIMKIKKFFPQKHNCKWYPCLVDPSRALNNNDKFYLFPIQDVVMHHMSTVRADLHKKYANSNLNMGDENTKKLVKNIKNDILNWSFENNRLGNSDFSLFRNKIVEHVENKFNIYL